MGWREKIKEVGHEYRSAPFWSWNDDLNPEILNYQLDKMKEGGFGGGFMHSREGLITPYLSEKWLECIRSTVEYAKKINLLAYLYDEDRWPSGFAGGIVTKKKKNRIMFLNLFKTEEKWEYEKVIPFNFLWYNNTTYLNTLNKKAVRKFINSTYEVYKKTCGEEFSKTVPAIFTDEPGYRHPCDYAYRPSKGVAISWTNNFEKIFKNKYGYDILKELQSLVEDVGEYKKVRYHYWRLICELFVENFGKQIYEWCQQNYIPLTGHYVYEDLLEWQTCWIGSAMQLYEYMQIPGIDHLMRLLMTPLLMKQCPSVANQLGRKRILSELYGCSGQSFDFVQRKWIADWHFVSGINLLCPHLYLYSLKGCRKRDYPPTISHHQPYWKYNKEIEDYFARICFLLSESKFEPQVLVFHPIETAWCIYNFNDTKEVRILDKKFRSLLEKLLSNHIDFDLGDECLISKYGSCEDGHFKVGEMKYEIVIIPPSVTLRRSTIELLFKFLDKGGKIVGIKNLPTLIEGSEDKENLLQKLFEKITVIEEENLIPTVENLISKSINIKDATGKEIEKIYSCHRKLNNEDIYFITNLDYKNNYNANISIKGKGYLELFDPLKYKFYSLESNEVNGRLNFDLLFHPVNSYVVIRRDTPSESSKYIPQEKFENYLDISIGDFSIQPTEPNAITLDMCQYRILPGDWSEKIPVLKLQQELEKENKTKNVCLKFTFETDLSSLPKTFFLVVEDGHKYKIKVNDKKVKNKNLESWLDPCFKKIDIKDHILLKGTNVIELVRKFVPPKKKNTLIFKKNGVEFESIYIIGEFFVKGNFIKVKEKSGESELGISTYQVEEGLRGENFIITDNLTPNISDFVSSGYPFYQGGFILKKELEIDEFPQDKIFLQIEMDAVAAKVTLNGKDVGLVYLPPYRIEITEFLRKGKNILEIEIVNTLRNLLGPHHLKEIERLWVGPENFTNWNNWVESYSFVPCGLKKVSLLSTIP